MSYSLYFKFFCQHHHFCGGMTYSVLVLSHSCLWSFKQKQCSCKSGICVLANMGLNGEQGNRLQEAQLGNFKQSSEAGKCNKQVFCSSCY